MKTLVDWSIVRIFNNQYQAPETAKTVLLGKVYGHPNHKNGEPVRTSELLKLNLKTKTALTKHSMYFLEEPNQDWLTWLKDNGYTLQQFEL